VVGIARRIESRPVSSPAKNLESGSHSAQKAPSGRTLPKPILSPAKALELLLSHAPQGETWPIHCQQVARVARCLADALLVAGAHLKPDDGEAQALVHDIGRSADHGHLHGWAGYQLMADIGHAATGRSCITHWLKGRSEDELLAAGVPDELLSEAISNLDPPEWLLSDSVVSLADSSVAGKEIVPLSKRHDDLRQRYGSSKWLDRHAQLAEQHATQISDALQRPVVDLLEPLYGTTSG